MTKSKPPNSETVLDEAAEIISDAEILRKQLEPVKCWLSSGCTLLDLAVSDRFPGGFPAGRVVHIYGQESTGKTIFAAEPLGAAQRGGGRAFFADAEHTFDMERARRCYGVQIDPDNLLLSDNWEYFCPETVEDLWDNHVGRICRKLIKDGLTAPSVLSVDSLAAIASLSELKHKMDKQGYGAARARQISLGFRKYNNLLNEANLCVIMIDQTRVNMTQMYGDKHTTASGEALKFYASVRIYLKPGKIIENKHGIRVGQWFKFAVKKNKVGPPYREGEFRVLFDYGIDDIGSNLRFLRDNDPGSVKEVDENADDDAEEGEQKSERSGPFAFGDQKFRSLDDAIAFIEANSLERDLQLAVVERWHLIHQDDLTRKPRSR